MISLPTSGLARSNIDFEVLCDWIEANVIFGDDNVSKTDVIDVLLEEYRVKDEDEAQQTVATAWQITKKRSRISGAGYPIVVKATRMEKTSKWKNCSAYSFCLLVSLSQTYDWWYKQFGSDYAEQGELFEEISNAALQTHLSGWDVISTGWKKTQSKKLKDVVKDVTERLGGEVGNLKKWDHTRAKEMGLDLLALLPFPGHLEGIPYYFVQCASGKNWTTKLKQPDLEVWRNMVTLPTKPRRAFCAPHGMSSDDFYKSSVQVDGLFLDRCRILGAATRKKNWFSASLKKRLIEWLKPRVSALQTHQ